MHSDTVRVFSPEWDHPCMQTQVCSLSTSKICFKCLLYSDNTKQIVHKKDFLSDTMELLAWCGLVTRAAIFMKNRLLRKMTSNLLFVISKHDKWEVAAATVRLDQSKTANWFCHQCCQSTGSQWKLCYCGSKREKEGLSVGRERRGKERD